MFDEYLYFAEETPRMYEKQPRLYDKPIKFINFNQYPEGKDMKHLKTSGAQNLKSQDNNYADRCGDIIEKL